MPTAKKSSHCTFRNGKLFCAHCGEEQETPMPMRLEMYTAMLKTFEKLHRNCRPTWKQPVPDQSWPVNKKAEFWFQYGEHGVSSLFMYRILSGKHMPGFTYGHPHDPDDFRRCYMLLFMVPEWKELLHEIKGESDVWEKLIDNWDQLTTMLEEQLAGKRNNMYQFMKKLGC